MMHKGDQVVYTTPMPLQFAGQVTPAHVNVPLLGVVIGEEFAVQVGAGYELYVLMQCSYGVAMVACDKLRSAV